MAPYRGLVGRPLRYLRHLESLLLVFLLVRGSALAIHLEHGALLRDHRIDHELQPLPADGCLLHADGLDRYRQPTGQSHPVCDRPFHRQTGEVCWLSRFSTTLATGLRISGWRHDGLDVRLSLRGVLAPPVAG